MKKLKEVPERLFILSNIVISFLNAKAKILENREKKDAIQKLNEIMEVFILSYSG